MLPGIQLCKAELLLTGSSSFLSMCFTETDKLLFIIAQTYGNTKPSVKVPFITTTPGR